MRPCGISPSFAFTMLLGFVLPSALRARALDSLVRVSRRVGEVAGFSCRPQAPGVNV